MPELILFTSPCPRRRASMHTTKGVQEHAWLGSAARHSGSHACRGKARLAARSTSSAHEDRSFEPSVHLHQARASCRPRAGATRRRAFKSSSGPACHRATSSALPRATAAFTAETRQNLVKVPLSMASGLLSAPVLPAAVARDGLGMAQNRARFLKADTSDTLKPVRDVP